MKGKISKYFRKKGFGFIVDENKENRFFHITEMELDVLPEDGMLVEFEPSENEKGKIAKNIKEEIIPTHVQLGETRIRLSNIKDYKITKETIEEKVIEVIEKGKAEKLLDRTFGVLVGIEGLVSGGGLHGVDVEGVSSYFSNEKNKVKKEIATYDVLCIDASYEGKFKFTSKDAPFNVVDKFKEIDKILDFKRNTI